MCCNNHRCHPVRCSHMWEAHHDAAKRDAIAKGDARGVDEDGDLVVQDAGEPHGVHVVDKSACSEQKTLCFEHYAVVCH